MAYFTLIQTMENNRWDVAFHSRIDQQENTVEGYVVQDGDEWVAHRNGIVSPIGRSIDIGRAAQMVIADYEDRAHVEHLRTIQHVEQELLNTIEQHGEDYFSVKVKRRLLDGLKARAF
jgi:hypothetical protein